MLSPDSSIQNHLDSPSELRISREQIKRRRVVVKSILVGFVAGIIACFFRIALETAEEWRSLLFQYLAETGMPSYASLAISILTAILGIGVSLWLVRRFMPDAAGSGIPHLKAVILKEKSLHWKMLLPIKFIAGVIGIGSGLALGREGPTVQMGGAAGMLVADGFRLKSESEERKVLISAGAAAGLAAAFNAPLAALMFVLEELYGTLTPVVFVASFLASVTADTVSVFIQGNKPVFSLANIPAPTLSTLPFAILLGLFCGILGVFFNKSLLFGLNIYAKIEKIVGFGGILVFTGILIGVFGWLHPVWIGAGGKLTAHALHNGLPAQWLLMLIGIRFLLTISSYSTGAAGGIFTPILVLGSLLGLTVGKVAHLLLPAAAPNPEVFAVIGMGALFTAIVRAPLTGIVLMIELTGEYRFMLPLLACSLIAYGVAEYLRNPPIYEALRKRK